MNYREKMREYLKEPDEYSSQYGKWGALNREQRQMITRLLNEMDRADEFIKHQFFEIERLNNIIDELQKDINLELMKTREPSDYNKGLDNAFLYIENELAELKGSDKE